MGVFIPFWILNPPLNKFDFAASKQVNWNLNSYCLSLTRGIHVWKSTMLVCLLPFPQVINAFDALHWQRNASSLLHDLSTCPLHPECSQRSWCLYQNLGHVSNLLVKDSSTLKLLENVQDNSAASGLGSDPRHTAEVFLPEIVNL